jgi:hypothetical protein
VGNADERASAAPRIQTVLCQVLRLRWSWYGVALVADANGKLEQTWKVALAGLVSTAVAPAATRVPFVSALSRTSVCDGTWSSNRSPVVPISVSMHRVGESVTISLDRPRTIIIYVLVCFACAVGSLVLADLALVALSRYG